ncbi:MAG: hypothetical protein V2I82_15270 [Halieaceae bacterium]|jgi:hypothetical protein|nr:hypothetical protein [Halieaceae bacterium]
MNFQKRIVALVAVGSMVLPQVASTNEKTSVEEKVYSMYSCTLRPFNRSYVDVAVEEKRARKKVDNRCKKTEGQMSIFCSEEKAECTSVKVKIRE